MDFLSYITHPPFLSLEYNVQYVGSEPTTCLKTNRLRRRKIMATYTSFNMSLFMDTHPPFDGDRFDLWKTIFEKFIKANDS